MRHGDAAAERGVLAGIYKYGLDAYVDVKDFINDESFSIDSNKVIYKCLSKILEDSPKAKIDIPLIMSAANSLGYRDFFTKPAEIAHLQGITQFPVLLTSVRDLGKRIKKIQTAEDIVERLRQSATDLKKVDGTESLNDIIGLAERPLHDYVMSLTFNRDNEPEAIDENLDEYLQFLVENQNKAIGISSGYPIYDACIGGGFRRGTVNIVGARAKKGKSTWGINVGKHVVENLGFKVLNGDTEMKKEDHVNKILSNFSDIEIKEIESGNFDKDPIKRQKVFKSAERLKNFQKKYKRVSLVGKGINEIISIFRRWVYKEIGINDNCLIIFDYLKIMEASELQNMKEFQLLGIYTTALHNFAAEMNIPILCFTQLNRDGIKDTHSGVVAASDRLSWFASNISIFKPKTQEEIDEHPQSGNYKMIPVDIRYGPGLEHPNDFINFKFMKNIARITEGKTYSQHLADQQGFAIGKDKVHD